jgi:hypothetical protein
MSNFVTFSGMKPVNLDHIVTFDVDGRTITFYPANPNAYAERWKFERNGDANIVYDHLVSLQNNINPNDLQLEGTYI